MYSASGGSGAADALAAAQAAEVKAQQALDENALASSDWDNTTRVLEIRHEDGSATVADMVVSDMAGTDGTTAGSAGLAPAPQPADIGRYLDAEGNYSDPRAFPVDQPDAPLVAGQVVTNLGAGWVPASTSVIGTDNVGVALVLATNATQAILVMAVSYTHLTLPTTPYV